MEILLPHKRNMETKIKNDYKGMGKFFKIFMKRHYLPWHQRNIELVGIKRGHIISRIKWFDAYLNQIDSINLYRPPKGKRKNWISAQSKFRSSALEEFICYLLKDIDLIRSLDLKFTNKDVFAGLIINSKGEIKPRKKDVDLALVKEEKFLVGSKKIFLSVPVVAIEVKTYLDKTMWGEAQFTALIIKRGNPACKVYVVAETNAVDINELQPDSPVDEIFILKRNAESRIDVKTACEFVREIEKSLKEIGTTTIKQPPGRFLHPK
ncbi:MAG: Bpu10I family restriction endonuclease [Candidatus Jordarchaeaceae archaeon]